MKSALIILTICIAINLQPAFTAEPEKPAANSIEQLKQDMIVKDVRKKNSTLLAIKEYGTDKYVKTYETESDQLKLIELVTWGSSTTEASIVRAEILVLLLGSQSDEVKIKAAENLLRYSIYSNQPDAVKILIAAMGSKNAKVRLASVKCIGTMLQKKSLKQLQSVEPEDLIEPMLKYYQDEDADVVKSVISLFPKTKDQRIAACMKKLTAHNDPAIRRSAFAFFAENEIKDQDVQKAALKTLGEGASSILPQRAASRYLGFIGDKEAVPLIGNLLKTYSGKEKSKNDNVKGFKLMALKSLGKIGGNEALKICIDVLQSDDQLDVIAEAGMAVQTIAKQDFGYEPDFVASQRIIADKAFKIWLIQDCLKEGDKRKDEVATLKKDVEKLRAELQTTIIFEKLQEPSLEARKKAAEKIHEVGIKKFMPDALKYEQKLAVLQSLISITGNEQFMKKNMEVIAAFLDDKDEDVLIIVAQAISRTPEYADPAIVIPKLEALSKSENMALKEFSKRALSGVKALEDYNKKQKEKTKENPKQKGTSK